MNYLQRLSPDQFFAAIIISLGVLLRVLWLGNYPAGFHSEEARLGYRGRLISQDLRDETGRKLPLFFTSFSGYEFPLASYLVAISVRLFGSGEAAVRFPFAVSGSLAIFAFYNLVKNFFPEKRSIVIWSTLVFALSPWLVFLSRTVSDWALAFHLSLIGIWILTQISKHSSRKVPIFLASAVIIISTIVIVMYFRLPGSMAELKNNDMGFFQSLAITNSINQFRGHDNESGNPMLGKLLYNKSYFAISLLGSLFASISPRFYFAAGDTNPLHGLTNFGPIPVVLLPIFFYGLWLFLIEDPDNKTKKIIIALAFLFFLIPSTIDKNSPNQEKLIFVFPFISLMIGQGASRLKRRWSCLLIICLSFNLIYIANDALAKEPVRSQAVWEYGIKDLATYLNQVSPRFDRVYLSDNYSPDIGSHLAYYLNIKTRLTTFSPKSRIDTIRNIQIGNFRDWKVSSSENVLFVLSPDQLADFSGKAVQKDRSKKIVKVCYQSTGELTGLNNRTIFIFAQHHPGDCSFTLNDETNEF